MLLDEDLGPLCEHFAARGCATAWFEAAHQSRTLRVDDPLGVRLEFSRRCLWCRQARVKPIPAQGPLIAAISGLPTVSG